MFHMSYTNFECIIRCLFQERQMKTSRLPKNVFNIQLLQSSGLNDHLRPRLRKPDSIIIFFFFIKCNYYNKGTTCVIAILRRGVSETSEYASRGARGPLYSFSAAAARRFLRRSSSCGFFFCHPMYHITVINIHYNANLFNPRRVIFFEKISIYL